MTVTKDKNILVLVDLQRKSRSTLTNKRSEKLLKKLLKVNFFDEFILVNNTKRTNFVKCVTFEGFFISNNNILISSEHLHTFKFSSLSFYNDEFLELLKKINNGVIPSKIFICGNSFLFSIYKSVLDIFDNTHILPFILEKYTFDDNGKSELRKGTLILTKQIGRGLILKGKMTKKSNKILFNR